MNGIIAGLIVLIALLAAFTVGAPDQDPHQVVAASLVLGILAGLVTECWRFALTWKHPFNRR